MLLCLPVALVAAIVWAVIGVMRRAGRTPDAPAGSNDARSAESRFDSAAAQILAIVAINVWGVIAASAVLGVAIPYTMDTLSGRITSARVVGTLFSIDPAMSVVIAALILRQTITAMAVLGVIVVSLAGALLVWSSGGDAVNG